MRFNSGLAEVRCLTLPFAEFRRLSWHNNRLESLAQPCGVSLPKIYDSGRSAKTEWCGRNRADRTSELVSGLLHFQDAKQGPSAAEAEQAGIAIRAPQE